MCYHKADYGIAAEWHFFGPGHGKSPCDDIGGVTKRRVANASLQRPLEGQRLTPEDFFKFCEENIHGIKYLFITEEAVNRNRLILSNRLSNAKPVPGTRDNYEFVPLAEDSIKVSKISNDSSSFVVQSGVCREELAQAEHDSLKPGQTAVCIYESK